MSAEATQNLERFVQSVGESRTRLEQMAGEARSLAAELGASHERLDSASREVAEQAPRALAALEAASRQGSAQLQALTSAAGAGLPAEVEQLQSQVGSDEPAAVEQSTQALGASHAEADSQGLEPLRAAAAAAEAEARETTAELVALMEAAFKSVTLGMDAVQSQSEQTLPALTGHLQLYAELDTRVSVAGDGFANRVNDGVLVPLGLDAAATAATAAGAVAAGGSFAAVPSSLGAPAPGLAHMEFNPAAANLIQDGGAYAQPAPLVAAGAGNLIGNDAGSLVAAGAGNLIGEDGASLVAAGAGNLIGTDAGSLVAAGAGNLIGNDAGSLVAAGGGNLVGNSGNT